MGHLRDQQPVGVVGRLQGVDLLPAGLDEDGIDLAGAQRAQGVLGLFQAAAQLLVLPAGGQYLNHLGTVHASAQLALAEASSGEYLLRALGSAEGILGSAGSGSAEGFNR